MFNNSRIDALEKRITALEKQVTNATYMVVFKPYDFIGHDPQVVPIRDVLNKILGHLGLMLKHVSPKAGGFTIEETSWKKLKDKKEAEAKLESDGATGD